MMLVYNTWANACITCLNESNKQFTFVICDTKIDPSLLQYIPCVIGMTVSFTFCEVFPKDVLNDMHVNLNLYFLQIFVFICQNLTYTQFLFFHYCIYTNQIFYVATM